MATKDPHGLNARQFASMVRFGTRALGRPDLGSVRRGHAVDLIAVASSPLEDISALRCVAGVIKAGRLIHRDDATDRCDRECP